MTARPNDQDSPRLFYVDDVKSFVIFLVVLLHASVTYSGLGGWYLIENKPSEIGMASLIVCGLFNSFTQAWFMGIMFFFGGYFARESLARRGPQSFVRDRILRLGIPLVFYVLAIQPSLLYAISSPRPPQGFFAFYAARYIGSLSFLSGTGPLWFAEILLAFSLALALVVAIRRRAGGTDPAHVFPSVAAPTARRLLLIALATAALAYAVRGFMPIGTSVLNLQFCYFSSYIVLFTLGVHSSARKWFCSICSGASFRYAVGAVAIGIPSWFLVMLTCGPLKGDMTSMNGGFTVQSLAYALWESFVAIAMSVGLTALFVKIESVADGPEPSPTSRPTRGVLSALLARNSFSVFVFHPVFLIALTRFFAARELVPPVKAFTVGVVAYALTLSFAELVVRKIPFAKKYL